MSHPIIECVPNFSEGRDAAVIEAIASAIRSVDGAKLLNVDPGASTHRTVYTFVGHPEPVMEAAVRAARVAKERIDMTRHQGEHPRFGALDVCPLIPIAHCTMDECVEYAQKLGHRLATELGWTIYLYGYAATDPKRENLSAVRAGEYEGLAAKLADPNWKPDFGPAEFNATSGASAVGARDFLIAYNVNLNTTSTRRANAVAFDIRERGRVRRENGSLNGPVVKDATGAPIYDPGALKHVKAIGWFIEEYGLAQVSINLTNIRETPLHTVFETTCQKAQARGMRVTGSELVGLVPLQAMLDAGRHFLHLQERSSGVSDAELIKIAVKSMGLDELAPFNPDSKIIEYAMRDSQADRLASMTMRSFIEETASESPAPGGGSIGAAMAAMGAALATMVANLSSHKRGWDDRWKEFSDWADQGKRLHERLTQLIDADTDAFNRLMEAFGLPKGSDDEIAHRSAAIQEATRNAIQVPLEVMRSAVEAIPVVQAMASTGNPNSVSDAGVGIIALRGGVLAADLNVRINAAGLKDSVFVAEALSEAESLSNRIVDAETEILAIVHSKL